MLDQHFDNYMDKFDIIDMHPISVECWDRWELISYFILKPKSSSKTPLNIEALPIIDKEAAIPHVKDGAMEKRD